jgi:hypothetical protein
VLVELNLHEKVIFWVESAFLRPLYEIVAFTIFVENTFVGVAILE